MILIGSRALTLRHSKLLSRPPKDFDFICTQDEYNIWFDKNSHKVNPTKVYPLNDGEKMIIEGDTNCEFEIIRPNTSAEILNDIVSNDPETIKSSFGMIPNLDILFTIKDSHKYKKFSNFAGHFWKNTLDWHRMKAIGCKVREEYKEFHSLRSSETYNYNHPKLNVSKADFFKDDNIEYIYDHDDIHKVVAINDRPAYLFYLKDGETVLTSKKKFFECDEHIRLSGVCEEALTLALERSLIPHKDTWTPDYAFKFALAKVATSITSGYFRQYAFENIFSAIKFYQENCTNYYDKFQEAVKNGKVKPFVKS